MRFLSSVWRLCLRFFEVLTTLTDLAHWCVLKWQYALNLEQYDIAQQLREKLTEVYEMMICYDVSVRQV